MQVFYAPDCAVGLYPLQEEESKHIVRVLRMVQGDSVYVVDGKGNLFEGVVHLPHPKHCILNLTTVRENFEKRPYRLHIAISPLKNADRFEWFVEKAVEIGIDEITPLICHRTERKNVNPDRINRIIESAMKQSLKAFHPILNENFTFSSFISNKTNSDCENGIAFCSEGKREYVGKAFSKNAAGLILIGPEGDFSDEEIALALNSGYKGINLGESRLRTETAGIAACHAFSFINAV